MFRCHSVVCAVPCPSAASGHQCEALGQLQLGTSNLHFLSHRLGVYLHNAISPIRRLQPPPISDAWSPTRLFGISMAQKSSSDQVAPNTYLSWLTCYRIHSDIQLRRHRFFHRKSRDDERIIVTASTTGETKREISATMRGLAWISGNDLNP